MFSALHRWRRVAARLIIAALSVLAAFLLTMLLAFIVSLFGLDTGAVGFAWPLLAALIAAEIILWLKR